MALLIILSVILWIDIWLYRFNSKLIWINDILDVYQLLLSADKDVNFNMRQDVLQTAAYLIRKCISDSSPTALIDNQSI